MVSPLLLWQLADSAFPIGGFAHSGGLEAAHHLGEVFDQHSLGDYLEDSLAQVGTSTLPFVAGGHQSAGDAGAVGVHEVDWQLDVFLVNHIANRSSRALGRGLLTTCAAAFASSNPCLRIWELSLREQALPGHLAPWWGAVCASLEVGREDCLRLFVFQHLRSSLSSAVRLGIVGPRLAQALQHRLTGPAETCLAQGLALPVGSASTCAPLLELFHAHHDRLYSRLFSS